MPAATHLREPLGLDLREVLFAPESAAAEAARTAPADAPDPARPFRGRVRARAPLDVLGSRARRHDRAQRGRVRGRAPRGSLLPRRRPDARGGARTADAVGASGGHARRSPRRGRREGVPLAGPRPGHASTPPRRAWSRARRRPSIVSSESLPAAESPRRRLQTSHAFHSAMMDPILPAFRECVLPSETGSAADSVRLQPHGSAGSPEAEATDPDYWVQHLRRAVRFSDGVATLLGSEARPVLLEVGPGDTLASLVRLHATAEGAPVAVHEPSLAPRGPLGSKRAPGCAGEAVARGGQGRLGASARWRAPSAGSAAHLSLRAPTSLRGPQPRAPGEARR